MSSKKTANFEFHLWEPQDSILRTEFNENTAKTDQLFDDTRSYIEHTHQSANDYTDAAVNALRDQTNTAVEGAKAEALQLVDDLNSIKPNLDFGIYVGNGSAAVRQIKLFNAPRMVLVCTQSGKTNLGGTVYGGLAAPGDPVRSTDSGMGKAVVELNGRSLMVYGTNTDGCAANVSGVTYYYVTVY